MSELPKVISSATVTIMGMDLTVHVLDNGQRVIEASDVELFFARMCGDGQLTGDEIVALAKVVKGVK